MKTQIYRKGSLLVRALVCACLFFSATFINAEELRSPDDMQLVQQHIGCEVIERRDLDDSSSTIGADNDDVVIIEQSCATFLAIYTPSPVPAFGAVVESIRFSPSIRAPPAV